MTTSDRRGKVNLPTATAHEHRLRIYEATRRPRWRNERIVTPWGVIRIAGKLGQNHADLLDAILYCAERKAVKEDGRIKILVDPARVRKLAGISGGRQYQQLQDELLGAVVEILEPTELRSIGHLVDHIDFACRADGTPITRRNPLTRGDRGLWRVELGKVLCALLNKDIWRSYNPTYIARLRHGVSQAVARHTLSHSQQPQGGWHLVTLIKAVTGEIRGQELWNRRRELLADVEALAEAGVVVEEGRVRRL